MTYFQNTAGLFLKDKTGITIKNTLEKIFKERKPKFLWTDRGNEFYNQQVQDLLNENNIELYSTNNSEIKSAVVERFNRTFKNLCIRNLLKIIIQYFIIF